MKYLVNAPELESMFIGTSLKGYLDIGYAALVATLGEPWTSEPGDKSDALWTILFADGPGGDDAPDGTLATIYNYKDGQNYLGDGGTPTEEITHWHVGGRSQRAVELVQQLFGKMIGEDDNND